MRLVIITYPMKTKITLKCVFRWNHRVLSSKKRFSLSRHSPTKNASPRGVDRYVDTNETNLDARYHQPYEVRLIGASHVENFDRHREILGNVSSKSSVVIVRFRRGGEISQHTVCLKRYPIAHYYNKYSTMIQSCWLD